MIGTGLLRICQRAAEAALRPDNAHTEADRHTFADAIADLHALADGSPQDHAIAALEAEATALACQLGCHDADWPTVSATLDRLAATSERFPSDEPIAASEAGALEHVWWRSKRFAGVPRLDDRLKQRLNQLRDRFPDSHPIRQARANVHMALADDLIVLAKAIFLKKSP